MLGESDPSVEKTSLPLQVDAEQTFLAQTGAARRASRFFWTGLGLGGLVLIGVSACALYPLAFAARSRLAPEAAFHPMPALGPRGIFASSHGGRGHVQPPGFRPAVGVGSSRASLPVLRQSSLAEPERHSKADTLAESRDSEIGAELVHKLRQKELARDQDSGAEHTELPKHDKLDGDPFVTEAQLDKLDEVRRNMIIDLSAPEQLQLAAGFGMPDDIARKKSTEELVEFIYQAPRIARDAWVTRVKNGGSNVLTASDLDTMNKETNDMIAKLSKAELIEFVVLLGKTKEDAARMTEEQLRYFLYEIPLESEHLDKLQSSIVNKQSAAASELSEAEEDSTATDIDKMDQEALTLSTDFKPIRGADGRLQPLLTLPGDTLETTPYMKGVTAVSTLTTLAIIGRAFVESGPASPLLAVATGLVAGEMFTGAFHWATDNYGSLKTPVVGFACAAFQGHHLAPWTISHRSLFNNVHKIALATIPLNILGTLALPPSGAAFFAVMLFCQLLAQDFHRWTHTPPNLLKPWQRSLQKAGIAMSFREHIAHHKPPFDKKYCILNGGLNPVLDSEPVLFWRRLEGLIYRLNGQAPHSWKDARVKEIALGSWPARNMRQRLPKAR